MNCEMDTYMLYKLPAQWITPEKFHPFGQVIFADKDGKAYDTEDAQLELHRGIPRFYIMRLQNRGRKFSTITRHQKCTQCLGSLEGKDWLIAVASPSTKPDIDDITAFRVPGNCFIKLEVGTWHAGPYFDASYVDFYNLELSDTNINDHETCNLLENYSIGFEIV
jgi:ureidoglycolate hydrolase